VSIYFTSDQHYYHKNICKFADRPFSDVDEMNEALIKAHNQTVSPQDTVWMTGDFAFSNITNVKSILRRLNGKKHLVLGNHDKQIRNHSELVTDGLLESIQDYREVNVGKQSIVLFHYGMRVWNKSHHGSWHLYGHSHGSLPPHGLSMDVGVDSKSITDEYRPYSFDEIKRFMDGRKTEVVDHHKKNS
jgi:calcineurin-like phosphoesterase family protein